MAGIISGASKDLPLQYVHAAMNFDSETYFFISALSPVKPIPLESSGENVIKRSLLAANGQR